ncbi:hypothetical protein [Psychrobacillus glaciei]|uniref:hypothetical protein n=1 Tax=Psychrobacillus glaciei TaxID=2283160 RepID=UPI001CEF9F9A|nr:hypothetical protein [Psychrobacillus glaciei]
MNKRFYALLILVVTILVGCSSQHTVLNKPPNVLIEIGKETYETKLGTYCWNNENNGVCVDTVGPIELLKGTEPIHVKSGDQIKFVMNYEPKPNEFSVTQMNNSEQIEISIKDNQITAPTEKGTYYYSYSVWWMDDHLENVSNGDAFYAFVIQVK